MENATRAECNDKLTKLKDAYEVIVKHQESDTPQYRVAVKHSLFLIGFILEVIVDND